MFDIDNFWNAVLAQEAPGIRIFFQPEARIRWHNTNEEFTVDEFIRANCEYPGEWDGKVERIEENGDVLITAAHVYTKDRSLSFHVVSFLRIKDGKILAVDEYWGDDGPVPDWRREKNIGRKIQLKQGL